MQPGWQLLGGYPEIRLKSAGFATKTEHNRGLEQKSWRGQGSAVPSLHPEGVGCNQPLLAHSLLQRVLQSEAKGACTHALDFEFKGSIKQRKSNLGASGRFAPLRPEGNWPLQVNSPRLGPGTAPGGYGLGRVLMCPPGMVLPHATRKGNRPVY